MIARGFAHTEARESSVVFDIRYICYQTRRSQEVRPSAQASAGGLNHFSSKLSCTAHAQSLTRP
jgi:hypothetical protein